MWKEFNNLFLLFRLYHRKLGRSRRQNLRLHLYMKFLVAVQKVKKNIDMIIQYKR
jgi:hypothetical protein